VLRRQDQQTELLSRIADQQLAAFAADHPDLYNEMQLKQKRERRAAGILLAVLIGVTIIPLVFLFG